MKVQAFLLLSVVGSSLLTISLAQGQDQSMFEFLGQVQSQPQGEGQLPSQSIVTGGCDQEAKWTGACYTQDDLPVCPGPEDAICHDGDLNTENAIDCFSMAKMNCCVSKYQKWEYDPVPTDLTCQNGSIAVPEPMPEIEEPASPPMMTGEPIVLPEGYTRETTTFQASSSASPTTSLAPEQPVDPIQPENISQTTNAPEAIQTTEEMLFSVPASAPAILVNETSPTIASEPILSTDSPAVQSYNETIAPEVPVSLISQSTLGVQTESTAPATTSTPPAPLEVVTEPASPLPEVTASSGSPTDLPAIITAVPTETTPVTVPIIVEPVVSSSAAPLQSTQQSSSALPEVVTSEPIANISEVVTDAPYTAMPEVVVTITESTATQQPSSALPELVTSGIMPNISEVVTSGPSTLAPLEPEATEETPCEETSTASPSALPSVNQSSTVPPLEPEVTEPFDELSTASPPAPLVQESSSASPQVISSSYTPWNITSIGSELPTTSQQPAVQEPQGRTCPENEHYEDCPTCSEWDCKHVKRTEDRSLNNRCADIPVGEARNCLFQEGCYCDVGHARQKNNKCVKTELCHAPDCGPNAHYELCPKHKDNTCADIKKVLSKRSVDYCLFPACRCDEGFVRESLASDRCVELGGPECGKTIFG